MKTGKQISLDPTRLYGFKITAQSLSGQQPSVLGSKVGVIKKTDSRIGSKVGVLKRY